MVIGLEKRLRKLENAEQAKIDSTVIDQEELARSEQLRKLRRTPESRAALRAYWQRMFRSMRLEKRERIEVMTSPEQLARLRIQWAKEDAESERLEQEYLKQAKVTGEELESFLSGIIGEADGDGIRKTLEKLEKIQKAKTDEVIDADEAARRRAFLDEVRRTPEGRALSLRVAQQLVSDMQARERAQIEVMTSPEQLARFKKQWADEDAKEKAREKRDAENEARRKKWDEEGEINGT